jgi:Ni,Fe-hydrogenase III small subunit/Pyruvate/2-oxoacid:ferredoxin oxidoreductase delta subunit
MLKIALARLHQGHRTRPFPNGPPPELPDRYRGRLRFDRSRCPTDCRACVSACPVDAIRLPGPAAATVDLGRCLFCTDCADACPQQAISHSRDYQQAVRRRQDLVVGRDQELALAEPLALELKRLLGRSLKLRQVSAGGCNACEADTNVLNTLVFDLARFGIQFVASPRHADGVLVTGPVSTNMRAALLDTYAAVPAPKIVIVVGACAISGGPYLDRPETCNGVGDLLPVDLYVPGCPPHPYTILDGLLRLLGRAG